MNEQENIIKTMKIRERWRKEREGDQRRGNEQEQQRRHKRKWKQDEEEQKRKKLEQRKDHIGYEAKKKGRNMQEIKNENEGNIEI
jgi:hypothetical protein